MKKFLKIAVILLFGLAMVFSSVGLADKIIEGKTLVANIDVEKYIQDPNTGNWVDADTENEALDVPICNDVTFKIIIHNNGDEPLLNLHVTDAMLDYLEFISVDPEPYSFEHNPPYYNMFWLLPGPLSPDEMIEIYIIAHVAGPECITAYNFVEAFGTSEEGTTVDDNDYCYVHAIKQTREFCRPFLTFLDCNPNIFPLIQKILRHLWL